MLGKARTGSGKTLGFGLPTLTRLAQTGRARSHRPHAVVLVPTRELAMQVHDALEPLAHTMDVSLRLVAGGLSMPKQIAALERGVHLVVATPGRLADLVRRGHADMSAVQVVVLDEADHMAEMGFMTEIEEILDEVPGDAQHLLFSATLDGDVDRLVTEHMHSPVLHDVTDADEASAMRHVVLNISPHLKYDMSIRIASREGRTIVFVRTKMACDRVAEQMRSAGVRATALHGDMDQNARNVAIEAFRSGRVPVLVATDVAARGIHVDDVDLVLQLDPPGDPKDYTHRAGRTARAGASGLVVTLALPHQRKAMDRVVEATGLDLLFRKVREADAETLAMVDALTGSREPSGVPARETRAAARQDDASERGGRGRQQQPSRGRGSRDGDRPTSERPSRERKRPEGERRGRGETDRQRAGAGVGKGGARKTQGTDTARSRSRGDAATTGREVASDGRDASEGSREPRGGSRQRQENPNPRKKPKGTKRSSNATRGRKGKPRPKKKR